MANIENIDLLKESLDKSGKELGLNSRKLSPADLETVTGGVLTDNQRHVLKLYGHEYKARGYSPEKCVVAIITNWPWDYTSAPTPEELAEWLDNNWDTI